MVLKIFKRYVFTLVLSASSLVVIFMALVYFFIATPIGGRLMVHYLLLQSAQAASVKIESFSGNLKEGLTLKNVHIQNWPLFGPEATISIQRVDVRLPVLDFHKIQATVFNARMDLPNSDPLLFEVQLKDGDLIGDVEAKMLDVSVLMRAFVKTDLYKLVHGTVTSGKLDIKGPLSNPALKGGFVADMVTYGDKVVHQVFAKVDVNVGFVKDQFVMHGDVYLDGGQVDVGKNRFDLTPSKVTFRDNLINPDVDLRCTIHKDVYDIDIRILGTIKYNKVTARSDPYLSQEEAFILLGMGNWAPLNSTSLNLQDDAKSLGIKRQFGENMHVGYGYEQSSQNFRGESNSIQFLQGQMSLSDGLSVNLEKTISSSHEGSRYNRDDPRKDNESRMYLKFQNTF